MKKKITLVALCYLIFTTSAFADLTISDLEKIQSIVDKSANRLEKSIEASEKRIKEYVDLKINALDAKLTGEINALDNKLTGEIKAVDGKLTQIYGFVIALVALIAIAVGIPHILVARQGKELKLQAQQIKTLQQESEMLKQERVTASEKLKVSPDPVS